MVSTVQPTPTPPQAAPRRVPPMVCNWLINHFDRLSMAPFHMEWLTLNLSWCRLIVYYIYMRESVRQAPRSSGCAMRLRRAGRLRRGRRGARSVAPLSPPAGAHRRPSQQPARADPVAQRIWPSRQPLRPLQPPSWPSSVLWQVGDRISGLGSCCPVSAADLCLIWRGGGGA